MEDRASLAPQVHSSCCLVLALVKHAPQGRIIMQRGRPPKAIVSHVQRANTRLQWEQHRVNSVEQLASHHLADQPRASSAQTIQALQLAATAHNLVLALQAMPVSMEVSVYQYKWDYIR